MPTTTARDIQTNNNTPSSTPNTNNQSQTSPSYLQSRSRESHSNFFTRLTNLFNHHTPPTFATETIDQQNPSDSSSSRLKRFFHRIFGKERDLRRKMERNNTNRDVPTGNEERGSDNTESPRIDQNRPTDDPHRQADDDESDFESRVAEFFPDSSYRDSQHNTNHQEETTESNTQANLQPQQSESHPETQSPPDRPFVRPFSTLHNNTAIENRNHETNSNTNTTSQPQPNTNDSSSDNSSNSNNNNTRTDNRAIVITVNYLFSDQNRPDNPNRSGSLVLSLPNNSHNRDPGSIQEFIRIATQMAYSMVMSSLQNQPRGITLNKFESFEKVNVRHFGEEESKVCSICFEEFEGEEEEVEEDEGDGEVNDEDKEDDQAVDDEARKKDANNKSDDKEGFVVRKRRRLVDKTSRLLRRFSRSHTEAIEDGERRTPNSEASSVNGDATTPIASSNASARPTIGTRSSSTTSPTSNSTQSQQPESSTAQPQQTQDPSRPVYLVDVKDPFDHSPIKMPCNHVFGQDCLCEWLKSHSTCPLCRFSVAEPVDSERGSGGPTTARRPGPNGGTGAAAPATGPGLFQGAGLPQPQHTQINGQNYTFYTFPNEALPNLGNAGNGATGGSNNSNDTTQADFTNRLASLLRPALMGQAAREANRAEGASAAATPGATTTTNQEDNASIEPLLRVMQQAREARERMMRAEREARGQQRTVRGGTGVDDRQVRRVQSAQPPSYTQTLRSQNERPFAQLRDTSPGLEGRMRRVTRSGFQSEEDHEENERVTRSRSMNTTSVPDRMRRQRGGNDYEEQERSRSFLPGYSEIMNYIRNGFSGLRNTSSRLNGDGDEDEERRQREMVLHPGGLISMRTPNGIETFTDEEVNRIMNRQNNETSRPSNANAGATDSLNANEAGGNENEDDISELAGNHDDDEEVVGLDERRRRGSLDSLSYHHRNYQS
ncbi:SAN1 [Candida metapsilosis]|uniref:SAN1 n=1 Tax=Candida metapsilosis TaxID=273372 RepID=A0A8H8DDW5_9ASCO|nr:SAN1 [Candida metapsilosis]